RAAAGDDHGAVARAPRVATAARLWEWLAIVGLTRRRGWSDDERRMMRAATRHHALRAAAFVLVAGGLVGWIGAARGRDRAWGLLVWAVDADYDRLAERLPELDAYREAIRPGLLALESDPKARESHREVARILLYRDQPTAARGDALRERLTSPQAQPE